MYNMIASYLEERWLLIGSTDSMKVTCGVPHGSVLGPTLWNHYYDAILKCPVPRGVKLIGYADDLAIVVVGKDEYEMTAKSNAVLTYVTEWLRSKHLSLAPHKTEVVILAGDRSLKGVAVHVEAMTIRSRQSIKYLRIMLDRNMSMGQHIKIVTAKATKGSLSRILPNIRGRREGTRRVLLA